MVRLVHPGKGTLAILLAKMVVTLAASLGGQGLFSKCFGSPCRRKRV